MSVVWLSLGSNEGRRRLTLSSAVQAINQLDGVRVQQVSSLYETPPWGDEAQSAFLNIVVRLTTDQAPGVLLSALQGIELQHGRQRDPARPWGPRPIDIDILLFDGRQIREADLVVPHPYLHERAFVLVPLSELSPELMIPGVGLVTDLLKSVDASGVTRLASAEWYQGESN